MTALTPRRPNRPLLWPDWIYTLRDVLARAGLHDIYIVGGAVRDALLHRPIQDLDLVAAGDGISLARLIANRLNGDFYVLDGERGVGRALVDTAEGRLVVDVAQLRGQSLTDDLADRDFTVNALAVDITGDLELIIDLLGGESDLEAKLLRRCGPQSLADDPVRALRAVRQSVQFSLRIESVTQDDIRRVAPRLADISPERLRDELFKLLALPRPAAALRVADALGLLGTALPEVIPLHALEQSAPHIYDAWTHTLAVVENLSTVLAALRFNRSDQAVSAFSTGMLAIQLDRYRAPLAEHMDTPWPNERSHRALLMLAALLHDAGKPSTAQLDDQERWRFLGHEVVGAQLASTRARALRLSTAEADRLRDIVQNHMRLLLLDDPSPRALHRFWRLGAAGVDVCLLTLADFLGTYGSHIEQDAWLALIDRVRLTLQAYFDQRDEVVTPPPVVTGTDLMKLLGLSPGPVIGQLLDAIREAQAAGEVLSLDDALAFARRRLGHNGAHEMPNS